MIMEHTGMVYSAVNSYCRKFPYVDKEELEQEAFLILVQATKKHPFDPQRGTTYGWIFSHVWQGFNDRMKRKGRRKLFTKPETTCHYTKGSKYFASRHFDIELFVSELSKDAQTAIDLALTYKNARSVRKRLREDHAWSHNRIENVFAEVQEALS